MIEAGGETVAIEPDAEVDGDGVVVESDTPAGNATATAPPR